ncbi:MAG: hypothetical protein PHN39_02685 [Candidatus Pacebacteria bacterium]|nr:hypothetical protein [Candidatus Paceibacterota bacterium]
MIIVSSLLALVQTSFFSYPGLLGGSLNLIFLLVIILSFSESRSNWGLWTAFWGGLFLDLFSTHPFGLAIVTLSSTAIIAKKMSGLMQKSLTAKVLLFLISFLCYQLVNGGVTLFFSFIKHTSSFQLNLSSMLAIIVSLGYHLLIFIVLMLLPQFHQKNNHRYGYF